MNKEDFVSLECAKLLKDKGYDEPCLAYYLGDEFNFVYSEGPQSINEIGLNFIEDGFYNAPSLYNAVKWLRADKKIDVLVLNCACGYLWEVSKAHNGTGLILFDDNGDDVNSGCWTTYESALNAGIIEALNLIEVWQPNGNTPPLHLQS